MTDIPHFITRWKASGASERANYALFVTELCDLLGVERPRPASAVSAHNDYAFERAVTFDDGEGHTSTGRIDLYKRGCFVLEAKQGADAPEQAEAEHLGVGTLRRRLGAARRGTRTWATAMQQARQQALRYARALPAEHGWPPFLVVTDVGYCVDLYADFARQGKGYVPFPDPASFRILLEDLTQEGVRERLRLVFSDLMALDPTRRAARVTRALAERLARLAASLEAQGHAPEKVAQYVTRCLFSMFAEDVGLLPERSFTGLLEDYRGALDVFPEALSHLWRTMDSGGFEPSLRARIPQFNGRLFKDAEALPVSEAQLALLIQAGRADWQDVEPAIFGTLLERALDPTERHKLGAHFTPRAYVERLVLPAVIEPLRAEFEAAQAAAVQLDAEGKEREALRELQAFHHRLCRVRVLDPACGSGNFVYIALEHLKRLEGEVLNAMGGYTGRQALLGTAEAVLEMTEGLAVTPQQLLGLEINPRAATVAEIVLWIGYLQWHRRTHGGVEDLAPPILRDFGNIQLRDAVLAYDERVERKGNDGATVTRWDGHTMKVHPTTGELVPCEEARLPVYDYVNPRPAAWPKADFIIGNPPFLGSQFMRGVLGPGYTEALREAYAGEVNESADLVAYFWSKAAARVRSGEAERFGFITTNSIKQTFNRRVLQSHMSAKDPLSLVYAVPDHPWVDSDSGAAVRIALTVGEAGEKPGRLAVVVAEQPGDDLAHEVTIVEREGVIWPDLTIGADVAGAVPLKANQDLSFMGVKLVGDFVVTEAEAQALGLGRVPGLEQHIPRFRNGSDITRRCRGVRVIDLFGLTAEEVRDQFPEVYQYLRDRVRPFRQENSRKAYRERWWIHAEPRSELRKALEGLSRYIATSETSKHRFFVFLDSDILPDGALITVASDDAYHLGVLSSRFHVTWALNAGGRLEDRPRYNPTRTFQPYPFPDATEVQQGRIRALAERIEAHRKARQALYEELTLTDVYNVIETLRTGRTVSAKEQRIYEQGAVEVLRELHDELDAAVADAYGWPADLDEGALLERLVALNAERAAEEARGLVRSLRPAYQNPEGVGPQGELLPEGAAERTQASKAERQPWPARLAERVQAVQRVVADEGPLSPDEVAERFVRAQRKQVAGLLETLEALGHLRRTDEGRYAA